MRAILIVDDEPHVAQAFRQYIRHALGNAWAVTTADNGAAALEFIASDGGELELCLTDYHLDDMTCEEMVRQALWVRPDLRGRFIVCTGAILSDDNPLFAELGCLRLDKPFALEDLRGMIASVAGG